MPKQISQAIYLFIAVILACGCAMLGYEQSSREDALINGFSGGPFQAGQPGKVSVRVWLSANEKVVSYNLSPNEDQKQVTVSVTKLRTLRMGQDNATEPTMQTVEVNFTPATKGAYLFLAPSTGATESIEVN